MKELGLGALWGLMTLMSLFPPSHEYVASWLMAPFVAVVCLHFGRRAFDRGPRLQIDAEGITDRTSILGGPLRISWDEVAGVSCSRWLNAVEVHLRDPASFKTRLGIGRRVEMLLNRLVGKRSLVLSLTLLGVGKRAVAERAEYALLNAERRELGLVRGAGQLPPATEDGGAATADPTSA